jgi:diguanylate cyclase (GGDEF)-like protein
MRALIADDDRTTTTILTRALHRWGVETEVANDGLAAWQVLTSGAPPSLAIVDWMMPGLEGIEICRRIRTEPSLAAMYVILLTGRDSRTDLIAGLDAGADDYMTKPIDTDVLRARVQVGTRVATQRGRLGDRVTELQSARDHLARLAATDALTELYSRRSWFELAATELSRSRRYGHRFSLLAIDLDFFKQVNDTFGHDAGDKVLQRFAEMLRLECRQSDIVGRLGGEEFALLVPETTLDEAQTIAKRIVEGCRRLRVPTPAGDVTWSCSVGISQLRSDDDDVECVLRRADAALYDAKRSGRDGWRCDVAAPPHIHLADANAHPVRRAGAVACRSAR